MRLIPVLFATAALWAQTASPFVQKPYLQLGNAPALSSKESFALMWHGRDLDQEWLAEVRTEGASSWRKEKAYVLRRIDVQGVAPHRVYSATLTNLKPGRLFEYRVLLGGRVVFESTGRARRPKGEPHRFAVFGDMSQDTVGQRAVAYQIWQAKPEYLFSTGDVVYSRGLVSEYVRKYFPIYNADTANVAQGAPLLRSIPTMAVTGNHDEPSIVDFLKLPDAFGFYYYWSLPMNGPAAAADHAPKLDGTPELLKQFRRAAPNFPRMSYYSFDYGDAHWTCVNSNSFIDWTDQRLIDWVRDDLKTARGAKWRIVSFHHPPFQSSKAHFNDQWMRVLAATLEEGKADIVFSGHVHNYQRTHPFRFEIDPKYKDMKPVPRGPIAGKFDLDKKFDGTTETKPDGVIWITTGAGGAGLYNPEQEGDPSTWQEFTTRFVSRIHSFTLVDLTPDEMAIRQIGADGTEIDRFRITR